MDVTSLLIAASALLGVASEPPNDSIWTKRSGWIATNSVYTYEASSTYAPGECSKNPDGYLSLPQVIHGVHQISVGGQIVFESGDPSFNTASSFYEKPYVPCRKIAHASEITWKVISYSRYFSRLSELPTVRANVALDTAFNISSNFIAAGALAVLSLLSFLLFFGKIKAEAVLSIGAGSAFLSVYFALSVSPLFGFTLSMLSAHKIADTAIWTGIVLYTNFFRLSGYLGKREFSFLLGSSIVAIAIILMGKNGDQVQFGTSLPFLASLTALISILIRSIAKNIETPSKDNYLVGIANLVFVLSGTNDILHIAGLIDSYTLLPIGIASGVFMTALFVNREIQKIYIQRDQLLKNLESLVDEKTRHLSEALQSLRTTQAELIQSARLASLGTLSAGIAHEINNSINFVNGALPPLERILLRSVNETDAPKAAKLLDAIKHGTSLTVEIVRSLRNYTGLNQSKKKDVNVLDSIRSILVILRSKVKDTSIDINIDSTLTVFAHTVGLNQIFMNLISNALDAIPPESGRIEISGKKDGDNVEIRISDNGHGIPDTLLEQVFDPFFTTKDVGKGTGLGLHIVKKEVDRHSGQIRVVSSKKEGTTFTVILPVNSDANSEHQEAA